MVRRIGGQRFMDMGRGFRRAAVAGDQVEMRGRGEGREPSAKKRQRRRDKAPVAPAAGVAVRGEGDARQGRERRTQPRMIGGGGIGVVVQHHPVARRDQGANLRDHRLRLLVAQKEKGDLRHDPCNPLPNPVARR